MNRKRLAWLLALTLLPVAANAFLGLGGRDDEKPSRGSRRYVLKVPDKKAEQELLDLMVRRKNVLQEMVVLERLIVEKRSEMEPFTRGLVGLFGFRRDGRYDYDPATRTLYELETGSNNVPAARTKLRELKNDAEARELARLMAGQEISVQQRRVLEMVLREKAMELELLERKMGERFSMVRGRSYEYDARTMRLFDVTPRSTNAASAKPAAAPRPQPAAAPKPQPPARDPRAAKTQPAAPTNAPSAAPMALPQSQIEVPVLVPMR